MTVLLAPTTNTPTRSLGGRTFRKQVLKAGGLDYRQGDGTTRRLQFDDGYFADLSRAFREGAYDSVKAIVADDSNRHTMDPERMRGTVVDLVPSEDGSGLDAIMTLSQDTARLVNDHPDLGVSARIVENLQRGDGKSWPRAIQHVLLTTDPRMTGLAPWRQVDLAVEDGHEVIDLSTQPTTGGGAMALSDEEMERLANMVASRMGASQDSQNTDDDQSEQDEGDEGFEDVDIDDATLEAFLDRMEAEDESSGESYAEADLESATGAGAELSTPAPDARYLDLAEQNASLNEQVAAMRGELSAAKWSREREELLNRGVPPHLLDLAAPVLEAEHQGAVVDLSNPATGAQVSPAGVIRQLLDHAAGYVDLSSEQGHTAPASEHTETAAVHAAWETMYGGKA